MRDATAERIFAGVRQLAGPGGASVTVPRSEQLVAMKVRAIVEAPERTWQDLADIGYLMRLDGVDLMVSEHPPLDLATDVPTTREDVEALRRLRADTPSWLLLTPEELDALLPADALDRRPTTSASATPFEAVIAMRTLARLPWLVLGTVVMLACAGRAPSQDVGYTIRVEDAMDPSASVASSPRAMWLRKDATIVARADGDVLGQIPPAQHVKMATVHISYWWR